MADTFDSLSVGTLDVNAIGIEALNIPRDFWIPGSASIFHGYFGPSALSGYGSATIVAAPGPFALTQNFMGLGLFTGTHTTTGIDITVGSSIKVGSKDFSSAESWKCLSASALFGVGKFTVASPSIKIVGPKILIGGNVSINGLDTATGTLPTFWNSKKNFDIPHPTKEGHRLRYVCLEGPSAEVYVRGTLKNSSTIELPEYWKGLVDEETIGVTLTPIGHWQELFWEKIEWGSRIIIKNNSGAAINCHYVVYGERKDTSKNIAEYEGLTPMDYPGDNNEYNINK
jgi:hypothetical protein